MTQSAFQETVVLETIDGYEFEKLCARIFQKLNYGTVQEMPLSGDGGRDLLIHSPNGLIVVECKHQPHTSIGRPVVQKLHSAVISSNGIKGILITTGKFSVEAIEHAKTLSPKIEMMDNKILADLATRAGIELILEGKLHTVLRYPLSDTNKIKNKISSFIKRKIESKPKQPNDLLKISQRNINFLPAYMIQYNINSKFTTSVGVIHREYLENGVFFVDGKTGTLLKQELVNHLKSAPLSIYNESDFSGIPFSRSDFVIDDRSLANLSKKIVINRHTKTVSYSGKNNQDYSKLCVPSEQDVFITNVKQIYLPFQDVKFSILNSLYHTTSLENAEQMLSKTDMLNCNICGYYLSGKGLLCNSCGALVHDQRLLDSHGFKCKTCGKTICRNCAYDLGINNKVCKDCAVKSGKQLILVSKNMHQRAFVGGGCVVFGLISFFVIGFICVVPVIAGIGILASDYRSKAPEYEIM
jgi:hypothetical protein